MCKALFCELLAALNEPLLIGFFGRKDDDDIVFGVGFVALTEAKIISTEYSTSKNYQSPMTYLQASILLQLPDRLIRKHMSTRDEIDRLHIRSQLFRRDRANPTFMSSL